jgi:hypothetical protein
VRCPVDLALSPPTIGASGGNGQMSITVGRECTWEARSESDWITLASPARGQGETTLGYTASPNALVEVRRGAIVVNEQRVEVAQAAAACTFALSGSGASVDAQGATLRVTVTAQGPCAWSTASQASWIQIEAGREGTGTGDVTLRVLPNSGPERRGAVVIGGQTYQVVQAAVPPPTPPPPTPPPPTPTPTPTPPPPPPPTPPVCAFGVSPASESVGPGGGDREVSVQASASQCTWTAVSSATWIAIRDGSGTGSGRVRYNVAANAGGARTATLTVATATVTVMQAAAPPEPITLRGRISGLSGRCPNLTFTLDGHTVRTDSATEIQRGCQRLGDRTEVVVSGLLQPDGSVLALRIRLDDDD